MAHKDTVVQGSRVQKEASKRVRRQASLRFSFSQPWCESTMQTQKAKRTDPEGPMHNANTVVALTVHTAFVPSQTAHDGQHKMQKLAPFSRGSGLLLEFRSYWDSNTGRWIQSPEC